MLGFCNPLIDATAQVTPEYLKEWNLKNDDAILADETYQPLIDDVCKKDNSIITQGGALQNTLVMAQWMIQKPGMTTIVGAVGQDDGKKMLEDVMKKRGVRCLYQEIPNKSTGCCAVLVAENNRSLVASVAASGCFNYDRWDAPEVLEAIANAKVVFFSGFFFRSSDKTALAVCAECLARKIPIAFGLSSPTVIESEVWATIKQVFRVCSIMISNATEAFAFGRKYGVIDATANEKDVDYLKLAKKFAELANPVNKRIIIITMGAKPTICCQTGDEPFTTPIVEISEDKIVDTNGAGDSYFGGFLSYYIQGKDIKKCLQAGAYASYINLQQRGCSVPDTKPNFQ
jgi:adenosine kinase